MRLTRHRRSRVAPASPARKGHVGCLVTCCALRIAVRLPPRLLRRTALSKVYNVIRRFSEDVDLTYDIRALAPHLVGNAPEGIDAILPSRSQEKKWSDGIRRELLPAWLRDHAHPVVEAELTALKSATSRVTEDCTFIDCEPVTPASSCALPRVNPGIRSAVEWRAEYRSFPCGAISRDSSPALSFRLQRLGS